MVEPENVDDYTRSYAQLHGVAFDKLRHPLQFYMEPEDHMTLKYWRGVGVESVGDFLFWCMYYGVTHQPPGPVPRAALVKLFEAIKLA